MKAKPPFVHTQREVALWLGKSPKTVASWAAAGMPGKDQHGLYDVAAIATWLITVGPWRPKQGDPMLIGDGSPWLEKYREARAGQEAIRLEEMRHSFVSVAAMQEILGPMAAHLRRTGVALGAKFGPEATALFNESLEEFRAHGIKHLGLKPDSSEK